MGADSELFKSFDSYFENVGKVLNSISREKPNIIKSIKTIISSLEFGGTVFWCGNGGSAADSQHLAAELVGRFKMNRPPLKSIALTTDTSILTAIANDYAFDQVFSRQVQALGRRNDVLVGISTSGSSATSEYLSFNLAAYQLSYHYMKFLDVICFNRRHCDINVTHIR